MQKVKRVVQIWLYNPEAKKIIIQKRSSNKKLNSGKFDISCAKFLGDDEVLEGQVRALKEELGINKNYNEIFFDKKYFHHKNYALDNIEWDQFVHRYFMEYSSIDDIVPNNDEVDGIYEVDIEEMLELIKGNKTSVEGVGKQYINGILESNIKVQITLPELVPKSEDYYEYSFYKAKEFVDVYNSNLEKIGVVSKEEAHKKGLLHMTFHCWIMRKREGKMYLVLQKRVKVKEGKYDISAAGHMQMGENKQDGIRELEEELGIEVDYSNLIDLGILYTYKENTEKVNRELVNVFLLEDNTDISEYKLQKEELDGIVEIELNEGLQFFSEEIDKIRVVGIEINKQGQYEKVDKLCTFDDFMGHSKNYYMKVLIMIERYFEGKKYLCI